MSKKSEDRGVRDQMHVGPDPSKTRHLVPMKELRKFEMADGDPDVRGWNVFTSTGRDIGEVEDLLVDVDTGNVVMIDIDLRGNNRHTLAPIRATWIDRPARRVVVDAGEVRDEVADLPSFTRGAAASDEEMASFDERYERAYGRHVDDNEYRVRRGREELRFGRGVHESESTRAPATDEHLERLQADQNAAAARRARLVQRQDLTDDARYQTNEQEQHRVRYQPPAQEEVIERRPYVGEVVVRRRPADPE